MGIIETIKKLFTGSSQIQSSDNSEKMDTEQASPSFPSEHSTDDTSDSSGDATMNDTE